VKVRPTRAFLLAAFIGAAAMVACSLNPQPIPPGEQADSGSDFGGAQGSDASTGGDGSVTGAVPPDADAGDAGNNEDDAGDASSDADTDAADE
jgi:hypothetical protein